MGPVASVLQVEGVPMASHSFVQEESHSGFVPSPHWRSLVGSVQRQLP